MRQAICRLGKRLVRRGFVSGSAGNISIRIPDGYLMTPTGAALDRLCCDDLSHVAANGTHVAGSPPTKEAALHRAVYEARETANAVIHTHSTHTVAVTLLPELGDGDALPPLTPYYVMRVGRAPVVPYAPPGDPALAEAVGRRAAESRAILLAHHGPVVAGNSLDDAADVLAELEETARLYLLVRGAPFRMLDAASVDALRVRPSGKGG